MTNSIVIKIVAGCLTAGLLFTGIQAEHAAIEAAANTEKQEPSSVVKRQAQRWVDKLSEKPTYSEWKSAEISSTPLGPGLHSWLVLIKNKETVVGYMVIHAMENGELQLGEYGIGEHPLFNEQSLQLSMLQLELIHKPKNAERMYVHPLQAAWRIALENNVYFADAYTGEGLFMDTESWSKLAEEEHTSKKHGLSAIHAKIIQSKSMPSFAPYGRMPWLTQSPMTFKNKNYSALLKAIAANKEVRYTRVSSDDARMQVWSVVGYDTWEGDRIFLALDIDEDDADRRYIPIELLLQEGDFYR